MCDYKDNFIKVKMINFYQIIDEAKKTVENTSNNFD